MKPSYITKWYKLGIIGNIIYNIRIWLLKKLIGNWGVLSNMRIGGPIMLERSKVNLIYGNIFNEDGVMLFGEVENK